MNKRIILPAPTGAAWGATRPGKFLEPCGPSGNWALTDELGTVRVLTAEENRLVAGGFLAHAAVAPVVAEGLATTALRKLCDQLDGEKRRMRHTPGTGQNHSYMLCGDVDAYVEEARKALAHPSRCEECVGTGKVGPDENPLEMDCEVCNGSGQVAAHPVAGSPAEVASFPVAWELHQAGFPANESPEVRIVLSSRMADEYIEEGWTLERTLLSDKRTKSYARGYDETRPASEAASLYEIQRDAAEQAVCANLVSLGLIDTPTPKG